MTVEQKVGQTIQGDISAVTPADLDRYPLGSILAVGNSGPGVNYAAAGAPAHRAIAREAVAKSLVLLKNNGSALPVKPGARVLVTGDGADNIGKQAGGTATLSADGSYASKPDVAIVVYG